uniref:Glycosyl hydrolases family 22 (GH22) domain-containing protein n=1 Tax=Glossina pallidipes TaxID=7398 RepID=A0A1A9ZR63_GLOPL
MAVVEARVLTRCELAREMFHLGIEKSDLATWTCIAHFESRLNTSAVGRLNGKWSNNFGLFQVSDRYWCTSSSLRPSANMCHQVCQELLTDNIGAAVECAQTVKQRQGWKAWSAYNGYCQHITDKLTPLAKQFFGFLMCLAVMRVLAASSGNGNEACIRCFKRTYYYHYERKFIKEQMQSKMLQEDLTTGTLRILGRKNNFCRTPALYLLSSQEYSERYAQSLHNWHTTTTTSATTTTYTNQLIILVLTTKQISKRSID